MKAGVVRCRMTNAGRCAAVIGFVWLGAMAHVGTAAAVEAAPHWRLSVQTNSSLLPGGTQNPPGYYTIAAKNIGSASTQGEYKLTDTLPAGIEIPSAAYFLEESPSLTCEQTGTSQITVTCSGEGPVPTGKAITLRIPLQVPDTATGAAVNHASVEGGGAEEQALVSSTAYSGALPHFEFLSGAEGVSAVAADKIGQEVTQAGAQPTEELISLDFPWKRAPEGDVIRLAGAGAKNIGFNLPKGVVVNPQATPVKCTEAQFNSSSCPLASQVGTISLTVSIFGGPGYIHSALYNIAPPPGLPAVFGFQPLEGLYVHVLGKVRSEGDYGLSAIINNIPAKVGFLGAETELWGVPTAAVHDAARGTCVEEGLFADCPLEPSERNGKSFLTTPTSCGTPLVTSATAVSNASPNGVVEGSSSGAAMSACNGLEFAPTIRSQVTTSQAESPSGLEFSVHMPQAASAPEQEEGEQPRSTANLKDVNVTLPDGLVLNPSSANGLGACGASQIGLETPVGQASDIHFDESRGGCPDNSRIGTVSVDTPLLETPLSGSVYLAKPFENPFGSLLAIYVAVEDEKSGVIAKLPGRVDANPITGQLGAAFVESPELPIEDINLKLFEGESAVLTTPIACGDHTTTSDLVPWTNPEGADANPSDTFQTTAGCADSEAAAPKTVSFQAGTAAPLSGAYSPFSLRIVRVGGTQHIAGIEATLPKGLLGKLAGVSYCPESGIALARSRETVERGGEEAASPACPAGSEVGTVDVAAGSGISPYHVSGHVYLAGPYKGAPLSLLVIVPAVAGPFDLGDVVDRVALNVDEYSAQIHAVADPLPTIRDGIPLDVRSIELKLDRPDFTLNPTSCEMKAIEGAVTTQAGQTAELKNSFQVGECKRLAFKPKLALSLKGPTKRTGHPALKAVVTYPQGGAYANIGSAQVSLPHSEFLDQGNIGKACTKPVLAAGACPAKSIYGKAKAWTPLLDKPLEGPVYLVGGYGYKLPALVADLNGQIKVLLVGKVDTDKQKGIRNTFETVPDAPVERFVLELKGGKKYGLLENSENICKKAQKAGALFGAQNGKTLKTSVKIANSCGKGTKKKKKTNHHGKKKNHTKAKPDEK